MLLIKRFNDKVERSVINFCLLFNNIKYYCLRQDVIALEIALIVPFTATKMSKELTISKANLSNFDFITWSYIQSVTVLKPR